MDKLQKHHSSQTRNATTYTGSGVRTHEGICPLDLKSNALTTRPSWCRRALLPLLFLQSSHYRLHFPRLLKDASARAARRSWPSQPGYRDSAAAAGVSRRRSRSLSPRALGGREGTAGAESGAELWAGGRAPALLAHCRCAGATNKLHS